MLSLGDKRSGEETDSVDPVDPPESENLGDGEDKDVGDLGDSMKEGTGIVRGDWS